MTLILCILVFGILIVVHEFGHFIAARLSGVRVEKFSVGFGPKIIGFKRGDTYYQISLIPLGGLVKLYGEEPGEKIDENLKSISFTHKSVLSRAFIVISGPVFNLLLPIVIFSFIFFFGWPQISTQVGMVLYDSPAWRVGMRPGDRIIKINDKNTTDWDTLSKKIKDNPNVNLDVEIQRGAEVIKKEITPSSEKDFNEFGEEIFVGKIGIGPAFKKPIIAVDSKNSNAHKLGFKNLDEIISVDNKSVKWSGDFEGYITRHEPVQKIVVVKRDGVNINVTLNTDDILQCSKDGDISNCGIYPSDLAVKDVKKDSPAYYAKIKNQDILYSLNGNRLYDFNTLQKYIFIDNPGNSFTLGFYHNGKLIEKRIQPNKENEKDELLGTSKEKWSIGIETYFEAGEVETILDESAHYNPVNAIIKGTGRTIEMSWLTLLGFVKLIQGRISFKNLGGPIMIYQLTGKSYKYGGIMYLVRILAILSISLGLINLVPIPVLDGGHMFFFALEAMRGKPVSTKIREVAQQVGFTILIMLTVLTFYNDIMRFFGK